MKSIFTTIILLGAFISGGGAYAGQVPIPKTKSQTEQAQANKVTVRVTIKDADISTTTTVPSSEVININQDRLDGEPSGGTAGRFMQCLISGTYDPYALDKNRYAGQARDNLVADWKDENNTQVKFEKAAGVQVTQAEIVQWSWAERARCQQSLGSTHANLTGVLGVSYILASDAHSDTVNRVSDNQLKDLGYLVLLPVVLDDLRAVGPTRRYYTSAVLGTSLISWRNNALAAAFKQLSAINSDMTPPNCFVPPISAFALNDGQFSGITALQAKVTGDIEAYNEWCKTYQKARATVGAQQVQEDYILKAFEGQRSIKWQEYATLINTNGYSKQASTANVLHKIVTLPYTLAGYLVGKDSTEYKLDDQAQLNGADAVELPILGGTYTVTAPDGELLKIAYALQGHLSDLYMATIVYSPKGEKVGKKADQNKKDGDLQAIISLKSLCYLNDAAKVGKNWYQTQALLSEISILNAKRYIILEVGSGKAYLSDTSVAQVKTSVSATPAPTVAAAPTATAQ